MLLLVIKIFKFKCQYCDKKYCSLAAREKHEMYNKLNFRYVCEEVPTCRKGFMFLCEYTEHIKKHTKQNLWICDYKDCGNGYAAKRTRDSHYRSHFAKDVHCAEVIEDGSICGQVCVSTNHLKQHNVACMVKGEHPCVESSTSG